MDKMAWLFIAIFIAGSIILLLPDSNTPVIRLNENHGPSFIDLIGLTLVTISWMAGLLVIIRQWKAIAKKFGKRQIYVLVLLYFMFLTGIIISLIITSESTLWFCAASAFIINLVLIWLGIKVKRVSAASG